MGKLMDKSGEVIEFTLTEKQIDELIKKLKLLKENKDHLHFDIDEENQLLISHIKDKLTNKVIGVLK